MLKPYQKDKIQRLFKKVKENETITVNKYEDSTVYFLVVMQYFEECYD